ncbi:MAG: sugar phosphate isomerase/epimerase [Fimbriiglobus sp.]|nr:sugar phosphate isomerase/epimerase [Fimbriiglobus sp.]
MLSRRSFLAGTTAAVAAAALPRLSAADNDANPYGGFTVGVQSYTFRKFDLERALKAMQGLGVRHAEFYRGHIPTDSTGDKLKAIKKLLAEYGVSPVSFGVEGFSKNADQCKKLFAFAAELGVKYLSADPDPDSLDTLDKLVAEYKIAIAIHPHGPVGNKMMHRWKSAEFIMKAVKDHHELIGTCLDTGHLIRSAQIGVDLDPAAEVKTMGARNFGLHLKDHDNQRKTDVVFGDKTGKLDVPGVLKALKEVKFKGYIAIEYEANENDPTADVKACLAYLKDQVKKLG